MIQPDDRRTPSPDEARDPERLANFLGGLAALTGSMAVGNVSIAASLRESAAALRSLAREVEALRRVAEAARNLWVNDDARYEKTEWWKLRDALSALNTEEPTNRGD